MLRPRNNDEFKKKRNEGKLHFAFFLRVLFD